MQPWEQVRELKNAGKPKEALEMAQRLLEDLHDDLKVRTQAEWACFDLIKTVVANMQKATKANERPDRADLDRLYQLLLTYADLSPSRPGMALSNILGQLSKIGQHFDRFLRFVKWAGPSSLRPEDFVPNEYQGKPYPSLVYKLAREAAAWIKSRPEATDEQVEFAVALAKTSQTKAKDLDKTWLEWDLASLLRRTGDHRGAAELIVRVLKKKRTESWAWAEAARVHRDEQPELAVACFCQALSLGEPRFLVGVHRELAELLAAAGDVAQATRETLLAVDIYDQEGWRHPAELDALLQAEWYDPALPAVEPKLFYSQHADEALTLCFDELRELPATYMGMTESREGKKPKPRFAMRWEDRFISILGRRNARVLRDLQQGSPVNILLGIEGVRRDVLEVLPRSDGGEWDCTEMKDGVIAGLHSSGEGITVYCSRDEEYPFPAKVWTGPTNPELGIGARVWGATNPVNNHFEAGRIEPIPLSEDDDIRVFSGHLNRTPRGFGFVDDVFVPPPLVELAPADAHDVAVVAVMGFDKLKQRDSWRAVAISPSQ